MPGTLPRCQHKQRGCSVIVRVALCHCSTSGAVAASSRVITRRRAASPHCAVQVKFADEQGVDEGGPSREFLQLVVRECFSPNFGMSLRRPGLQNVLDPRQPPAPDAGRVRARRCAPARSMWRMHVAAAWGLKSGLDLWAFVISSAACLR